MKLIRSLDEVPARFRAGAVSIGNFDGVHRGHMTLVERLVARAREHQGPAVVFTFDPHPTQLLRPQQAPVPLTWIDRKAELLGKLGVDVILAYPTTRGFLQLEPEAYFQTVVLDGLAAQCLVEGPNFFFGHQRRGNVELLRQLCEAAGVQLEIVQPVLVDDQIVSSSRIRQAVAAGEVGQAATMLTQPYRVRGLVTHGARRGRTIGFPTANLEGIDTVIPAQGVYAARAWRRGRPCAAAVNIGPAPTFSEHSVKIEVHLIGVSESLYGEVLEVDFLEHLRDIRKFETVDLLIAQLQDDVRRAASIAAREKTEASESSR